MSESLLNPDLDLNALRAAFQQRGRVKVPHVLRADFAHSIADSLHGEIPWQLAFYNPSASGKAVVGRLSPAEQEAMNEAQRAALLARVEREAQSQFQYLYDAYDVLNARRNGQDLQLGVQRFLDFLGTDELWDFMHAVSGSQAFDKVDCHACRYRPGHFLREHGDHSPFEQRHMAYVFYFTRDWHADFGGVTHFLDEQGVIRDSYAPDFNSLTLFRVPVAHNVSQIASYAPGARYSITGWFTRSR